MIAGLDSAFPPSDASIAQAYAGGVRLWAGYFSGPNILNGWAQADFDRVRAGGMATIAFCSGFSDPAAMKAQSLTWNVPICLDVEGGIRADNPWVVHFNVGIKALGDWTQPWLNASGAGLYGNSLYFQDIQQLFISLLLTALIHKLLGPLPKCPFR
jgi:hypothetical protein